jgi:hypothetical protein
MSFILNCGWYPAACAAIQARIEQVARLLEREETVALVGANWYRLGRSKKAALSKPLSLAKLREVRSWHREKFVFEATGLEEIDYRLDVWNGRDPPDSASLSVHLNEPTTEVDAIVFRGPDLESLKDRWPHVLALGEAVAQHFGGECLVSSNTIIEWARAEGLERADMAGYAIFHGDGRSIVSAATWPEVIAPDRERAQEFIRNYRAMFGD